MNKIRTLEKLPSIKIPLHGERGKGKYTLVDGDYDGEYFSQFRWYLNNYGYVIGQVNGEGTYLHQAVIGYRKVGLEADHINRDKLDNRSCNLRLVSHSVNMKNRDSWKLKAPRAHNTSSRKTGPPNKLGYRGVGRNTYSYKGRRIHTSFYAKYGRKHLGSFETAIEAAKAYDSYSKQLYGSRAFTNFS